MAKGFREKSSWAFISSSTIQFFVRHCYVVHNEDGKTVASLHRPADLQREGEERVAKRR